MLDRVRPRGIGLGVLGGFLGTLLMDTVMMATFVLAGEPADLFFSAVGEKMGGGPLVGVGLHNLVGIAGGIVFSVFVLLIEALDIRSMRKGVLLGLIAGAITIPAGCIPLALWLGEPIVEVVGFSIVPHLVWGTVLGAVFAYGMLSISEVKGHGR